MAERTDTAGATAAKGRSPFGVSFWLPVAWLLLIVFCAAFAPWLGLQDPAKIDYIHSQAPPSSSHWLGTDGLGRDMLSRVIYGARVSLVVGLTAPAVGMTFGLLFGIIAGYYRGKVEAVVVATMDTVLALPGLVLLLLISLTFGGSLLTISVAVGLLSIPYFTRVSRANTLTFASREFVLAAQAMGATNARILMREIFPNVVLPILAYALVAVAGIIVIEGSLSFLGLSVSSPTPSWGGSMAEGQEHLEEAPHIALFPASAMFLTVLSFNLVGDTLRRHIADIRESAID